MTARGGTGTTVAPYATADWLLSAAERDNQPRSSMRARWRASLDGQQPGSVHVDGAAYFARLHERCPAWVPVVART
jgi:hypothetical protein